jgi:hypothetical protein
MDIEVWSTQSGNCLASFDTLAEATEWILDLSGAQGEQAIEGFAVGNQAATWALRGEELQAHIRNAFWRAHGPWETGPSATPTMPIAQVLEPAAAA